MLNSRVSPTTDIERRAPKLPTYNARVTDMNKVAAYVDNLTNRLAIPKASSRDSKTHLDAYLKGMSRNASREEDLFDENAPHNVSVDKSCNNSFERLLPF